MSEHPLTYRIEGASWGFLIREIEGTEQLSRAWRLHAKFKLDHQTMTGIAADFDPDDVIKHTATIVLERDGLVVRRIQGVVMECELSATMTGAPEIEMVVEPRLGLLQHRRDVRIHRNLDVPQIVTEVCQALGVKIDNRLIGSYPNRPYCVQWRETDYDYVNRLLEDEGIFYYFRDGDVMVLGDSPKAYEDVPGDKILPFKHEAGLNLNVDAVHELGSRARLTAGKVTLRDWNTEHPSLDMDVSHDTALPVMPEWYDYPGEYEEPAEGTRKAALHAEAFDRQAAAIIGKSTCGRLYPGCTFTLVDAPVGAQGGGHVVRKVEHVWHDQMAGFSNAFEADPDDVIYRPARATHVPRIFNPHTGFVCTNGEDIHCDHFGRTKIHFHWDRLRPHDDDCSHWIPSLQDNTGGSSAIPRKNWEMVVHYLEGDPDRPIIVGRVYNGDDVFQEKLPYAKDRSSLTSQTSPDRASANEVRFEDAKGMERILTRAPKDMKIRIASDQNIGVGNTNSEMVENDETISIGGDAEWTIGDKYTPTVTNNQNWEVVGNRTKKVGASDNNMVGGNHELKVGGNFESKVHSDVNYSADNLKEIFEKNLTEKYKTKHSTTIGGTMKLTIGAALDQVTQVGKSEQNTQDRTEHVKGSHRIESLENEVQMRYDTTRNTTVQGSVRASCMDSLTLVGSNLMRTKSGSAAWKAGVDITLVVSDASHGGKSEKVADGANESYVMLKDGQIKIKAMNKVLIDIAQTNNQGSDVATQISAPPEK